MTYREKQIAEILKDAEVNEILQVQIKGTKRSTKWLNLTTKEAKKISKILSKES